MTGAVEPRSSTSRGYSFSIPQTIRMIWERRCGINRLGKQRRRFWALGSLMKKSPGMWLKQWTVRSAVFSPCVCQVCQKTTILRPSNDCIQRINGAVFSGQTFHVDKDPCLQSVLRAKLCIPNKALLWETLYTLHIHGIFVLKLFHHLMIFLGSSPAFWLLEGIGFGQIHSEKVDFLHVPFGASQPQQKIPTKKSCIYGPVCEPKPLMWKKRYMLRSWFGKIPPNKQRLVEAIFFRAVFANSKCWAAIWQATLSHYAAKNIPPGWLHHEKGLNLMVFCGQGTLNEVVECPCHPGTLIIFDHFVRRFFFRKQSEPDWKKDKQIEIESIIWKSKYHAYVCAFH